MTDTHTSVSRRSTPLGALGLGAVFDSGRVESRVFTALAVALIGVRVWTFVFVEGIVFDSDEALYGLMAKHISEFRAFPLFSYGEGYQMAVEAWLIAPVFWLLGPTVLAMKVPLVVLNVAVAAVLMRSLQSELGLRPALAMVVALPFIMPTPVVAGSLMENSGSATGPLIYIPLLWLLRKRPFAFGMLLMFGYLHREFTLYAVPALLVVRGLQHRTELRRAVTYVLRVAGGAAVVWLAGDLLQRYLLGISITHQTEMLANHTCLLPSELPARLGYAVSSVLPVFSGGLATPLYDFSMRSGITTGGFVLMGWAVLGMLSVILLRSTAAWRRWAMPAGFGVFLALVGMISVAAYPLGCNLEVGAPPVLRYLHLSLFIPIGLCAAYLARERHSGFRAAAVLVCVVWAGVNLADNVRLIHAVRSAPEENPHRELADYLMASGVRYAGAGFWDAYAVTFLSGERVIVEPHAPSRIPEYRRAVEAAGADAVTIVRRPCEADVLIAGVWCIEPAPHLR